MARFNTSSALTTLVVVSALLGCSENIGSPNDYEQACTTSTRTPPPPEPWPESVSNSVDSITAFNSTFSIDNQQIFSGNILAPAEITNTLSVTEQIIMFPDAKLEVDISTSLETGKRVAVAFVKIDDQSDYRAIPVNSTTGSFSLTFRAPRNNGTIPAIDSSWSYAEPNTGFPIEIKLYLVDSADDAPDLSTTLAHQDDINYWVHTISSVNINPQSFGTGPLQFTLIWDQANDIDMLVYEPNDNLIWYAEIVGTNPAGDGKLDVDDRDGFGAENIFYTSNISDGTYRVDVNYFGAAPGGPTETLDTEYTVIIKGCGEVRSITDTLTEVGETDTVFTFNHSENCTLFPPPEPENPDFFQETAICDLPSKAENTTTSL